MSKRRSREGLSPFAAPVSLGATLQPTARPRRLLPHPKAVDRRLPILLSRPQHGRGKTRGDSANRENAASRGTPLVLLEAAAGGVALRGNCRSSIAARPARWSRPPSSGRCADPPPGLPSAQLPAGPAQHVAMVVALGRVRGLFQRVDPLANHVRRGEIHHRSLYRGRFAQRDRRVVSRQVLVGGDVSTSSRIDRVPTGSNRRDSSG